MEAASLGALWELVIQLSRAGVCKRALSVKLRLTSRQVPCNDTKTLIGGLVVPRNTPRADAEEFELHVEQKLVEGMGRQVV